MGFVKGGTTTAAWDRQKDAQYRRTADGRAEMGRWNHAQRTGEYIDPKTKKVIQGSKALVASLKLGTDQSPKLLFTYVTGDVSQNRECLGELLIGLNHPDPKVTGATDSAILLVCPKCLERVGRMDDAQVIIRHSHREFFFRPYGEGDVRRLFFHPKTGERYDIAGEVTCEHTLQCTALGCTWKFRIDQSKVYTL